MKQNKVVFKLLKKLLIEKSYDKFVELSFEDKFAIIHTIVNPKHLKNYMEGFLKEYKEGTPEYIAAKIGLDYFNSEQKDEYDYYQNNFYYNI